MMSVISDFMMHRLLDVCIWNYVSWYIYIIYVYTCPVCVSISCLEWPWRLDEDGLSADSAD